MTRLGAMLRAAIRPQMESLRRAVTKPSHKCEHPAFHETMACDGVCMECGKNLGFIGNLDRSKCVADNDPIRWNNKPHGGGVGPY